MGAPRCADVAIVGAGPAGAWAARRLAASGARVVLIDPSHPREKPCGGGITGRALGRVRAALGEPPLPAITVSEARFTDPRGGAPAVVALGGNAEDSPLLVASREAFDGRLVRAAVDAGAMLVQARALDVSRDAHRFRIATGAGPLSAAFLIGADGANSLVRRRLSRPLARDQISIATGFFVHGAVSNAITLEFSADPPGYLWSFPRPTHLAVGICAQADAGAGPARLRIRAAEWIRSARLAPGAALQPYAWPIPSLTVEGLARNAVSGPGWCLVGDAAGLVDPITREGIFFALESAELAAAAFAAGGAVDRTYACGVADVIRPELARAARWKAGFFRPAFTTLLLDALRESAGIRAVMADLAAGRQPYATLAWRLAATREWRLMGKAALLKLGH
jgi:geranylgeranyl reductase family protein